VDAYEHLVAVEDRALRACDAHRYEEAIEAHGRALNLARGLDRPRLVAVIFNRVGQTLEARGSVQRAVIAYESGFKALSADPSLHLDSALETLGLVSKAFEAGPAVVADLYSEATATDLRAAEADPRLPVILLINIGNAYVRQPQNEPALNAYQQALQRPEMADAPELRAHALTHIAIIYRRKGDNQAAETALGKALQLLEAHAPPAERRRALAVLAGIQRDRGQASLAVDTYRQALSHYAGANDPRGEGRTLAGLGHLYLEQGQCSEALPVFQRAVALAESTRDEDTLWHAYWGLGCCQEQAGDLTNAAGSLRSSLDKIRARQQELRTDEGKVTFLESVQEAFDHLLSVHLKRAHSDPSAYGEALAVAEEARGQALHDLMGMRRRRFLSRRTGVRASRTRPVSPAAQMAPGTPAPSPDFSPMAQMAPATPATPGLELADLSDSLWDEDSEAIHAWREAAAATPAPRWPDEPQPAQEPESSSPQPLARLVFHVLAEYTAVFAVTPQGAVHGHTVEWSRQAIGERVARLRHMLGVDDSPRGLRLARDLQLDGQAEPPADPKPLLRELYDGLIAPVAQALPSDGTVVVVEPHGALWLLPFAALLGPDGVWLADRWPLLCTPSAQVLDEIRQEPDYGGPKDLPALVVGNPIMPRVPPQDGLEITLQPLPGAEQEARAIASLFEGRCTLLLGTQADWASVVARMPRHGILHLATHGIAYAGAPLASFVALGAPQKKDVDTLLQRPETLTAGSSPSQRFLDMLRLMGGDDGLLTAQQVVYMPLPADLVGLSACQTGLGRVSGEGMIGLSRAFLVAGARAVLVSQWSVSDEATAALMAAFYRGYLEWDNKALALQRAMQALRANPAYANPRYWAPFVVVGAEA